MPERRKVKSEAELLRRANIPHEAVPVVTKATIAESKFDQDVAAAKTLSNQMSLDIKQEKLNKLRQQHAQRKIFFWWAVSAISAVLAGSAGLMIWYMAVKGDRIEAAVMIAWLSSGLVETLGLGYIIANYLFEQKRSGRASKRREPKG